MLVSLIVAMAKHRVIGWNDQIPWHLSADLKHFKSLTMGKPIIMGRKTFESIGRALPGRRNLVLSKQKNLIIAGCEVFSHLEEALATCDDQQEVMVIGGAAVYKKALPIADRMYLTFVDHEFNGDTFFPEWDEQEWQEVTSETHSPDDKNAYAYRFVTLDRKAPRIPR